MGRHSEYTPEIGAKICELLAEGNSAGAICEREDMPSRPTLFRWLYQNADFRNLYAQAREHWADAVFEEIFDIADTAERDTIIKKNKNGEEYEAENHEFINRSRLRVDTRKWALARMSPKKYGELIKSEISGPNGGPIEISDDERARRLKLIFDAALQRKGAADANSVDDLI